VCRGFRRSSIQGSGWGVRVDLCGKLHWEFVKDFVAEARDDDANCRLWVDSALLEIEELVLADLGRGRFVLDTRRRLAHVDVWVRVGARAVANKHGVALRAGWRVLGLRITGSGLRVKG